MFYQNSLPCDDNLLAIGHWRHKMLLCFVWSEMTSVFVTWDINVTFIASCKQDMSFDKDFNDQKYEFYLSTGQYLQQKQDQILRDC